MVTIRHLRGAAVAALLVGCSPPSEPYDSTADTIVTDPTTIVASIVLSSKVVGVDPPKRFGLTFENDRGDRGSIRISKRCSGWRRIPVGTVRRIRWTTFRSGADTWIEPSDDGQSIRDEFCR